MSRRLSQITIRRLIDAVKEVITIALIIAGCSYIFLNAII